MNADARLVVVVGRTYNDAQLAAMRHTTTIPELADARMMSTFQWRSVDGVQPHRVYVAPGTEKTSPRQQYRHIIRILDRCLRKTPGADPVIHQLADDGSTTPVDVARLVDDIPF